MTYFVVRIRVNAVTAVGCSLLLLLVLGVDDALLWAVGAFFLSFVPYLGLILALIPPTILAFAEIGPARRPRRSSSAATVLNLVAENVLEPTLTGRALSLSTWLVFAMFFFWVWLLGPVGALLSMPITVLVVLVLQHNERTRWVAALLTRQGTRGDRARVRRGRRRAMSDGGVRDPARSAVPRARPRVIVAGGVRRGRLLVRAAGAPAVRRRRDHRVRVQPVHRRRPGPDPPLAVPDRRASYVRRRLAIVALVIAFAGPVSREIELLVRSGSGRPRDRPPAAARGDSVTIGDQTLTVEELAAQLQAAITTFLQTPEGAIRAAEQLLHGTLDVVLVIIVTFFLLLDGDRFGGHGAPLPGTRPTASEIRRVAGRIHVVVGQWLRGQLVLDGVRAVIVVTIVFGPILHLPYPLALGVIVGAARGDHVHRPDHRRARSSAIVALSAGGLPLAIAAVVFLFVLRQIEDVLIMPAVLGRAVDLHPLVALFAVVVASTAFGIVGTFLGVPVAAGDQRRAPRVLPGGAGPAAGAGATRAISGRRRGRGHVRARDRRRRPGGDGTLGSIRQAIRHVPATAPMTGSRGRRAEASGRGLPGRCRCSDRARLRCPRSPRATGRRGEVRPHRGLRDGRSVR